MTKGLEQAIAATCMLLATTALAAGPDQTRPTERGARSATEAGNSAPAGGNSTNGPQSPARESVGADFRDGRQQCDGLAGKELEACEARAAATAEVPRGREGANPTGQPKPSAGSEREPR